MFDRDLERTLIGGAVVAGAALFIAGAVGASLLWWVLS